MDTTSSERTALIEKYRDINTGHDWWEYVYEVFCQDMADIGIRVDQMYFSGFWSQGDGACFEGAVTDWRLFLGSMGYTDPALVSFAEDFASVQCSHRGHYYHENCTFFDIEIPSIDPGEHSGYSNKFLQLAWAALMQKYDLDDLAKDIIHAFKDHMRELYARLSTEYDHLTSDDAVWETIEKEN